MINILVTMVTSTMFMFDWCFCSWAAENLANMKVILNLTYTFANSKFPCDTGINVWRFSNPHPWKDDWSILHNQSSWSQTSNMHCSFPVEWVLSIAGKDRPSRVPVKAQWGGWGLEQWPTKVRAGLTHWGQDKIDAISQTTFSSAFSWIKIYEFRLIFHCNLFLRVPLTIFQHWFR